MERSLRSHYFIRSQLNVRRWTAQQAVATLTSATPPSTAPHQVGRSAALGVDSDHEAA